MDNFVMSTILNSYNHNCAKVNELALHTVADIQIPLYNSVTSLSILEFCYYMKHVFNNINYFTRQEQGLALILITDAATCFIKYKYFYESTLYLNIIFKALNRIIRNMISLVKPKETSDDFEILKKDALLIMEYIKRLPSELYFKTYNSIQLLEIVLNKRSINAVQSKISLKCDYTKIEQIPFCLNDCYEQKILNNNNHSESKLSAGIDNEKKDSRNINEIQKKRKIISEQFLDNIPCKQIKHNISLRPNLSKNPNIKIFPIILSKDFEEQVDTEILSIQNKTAPPKKNAFAIMMSASKLKFKP